MRKINLQNVSSEMERFVRRWQPISIRNNPKEIVPIFNRMRFEARTLGQAAYELGGFPLMRQLHQEIPEPFLPRTVELLWSGIGTWRA